MYFIGWQHCFPLYGNASGSDFILYDSSDLSFDEMVGAWCFGCWQAHRGLPAGFFFCSGIQFYVLLSPFLCFISFFISWFICFWRWCIDKLAVFHVNQTSMCLNPHLNLGWGWRCEIGLFPRVKYFSDRSKGVLLLWIICAFCVLCFSCFCVCSLLPCGYLLGKGWPLGSCWWCLLYFCYFPMRQVWFLIASFPDLCLLSYF